MQVKCTLNHISAVNERLHSYAFDQDENGKIDITIDKIYEVYGTQENHLGKFFLVLTDELNNDMPWWMPAELYELSDQTIPVGWITKDKVDSSGHKIAISSYPIYFDAEEDIEDSTEKGYEVFGEMQKLNSTQSERA